MGHVWMFHRYGIPTAAPMFLPGLGAVTRGRYYPTSPIEAARVGLAGPMWGLGAAAVCYVAYVASGVSYWGALAQTGGYLNLLNLLPIIFLDGNQGIRSLSRGQRALAALACFGMYYFTAHETSETASARQNPLLLILGIIMGARTVIGEAPRERDDFGLFQYVLLILTLGALAAVNVQLPAST
jgi:hypothetical protein